MSKFLKYSCYLYFFLTPLESISIVQGGGFSLSKLAFLIFLFAFAINLCRHKVTVRTNKFLSAMALYALWCGITCIFSINMEASFERWLNFVIPSLILIFIVNATFTNTEVVEKSMWAYIFGSFIPAYVLLQFALNPLALVYDVNTAGDRVTALANDQNELSTLLCISIVYCFYLIKNSPKKIKRILLGGIIFLLFLSILMTGSRTGAVVGGFIILLGSISILKKYVVLMVVMFPILGGLIMKYVPESNINRILETDEQLSDHDLTGRGYIWEKGWQAFMEDGSLVQGVGYDQFRELLQNTYGWNKAPHNTYLATLIELGIIGLILFLYLLYIAFFASLKLVRRYHSLFYFSFLIPVLLPMMTLGLSTRRWIFISLFIIYKLSVLTNQSIYENHRNYTSLGIRRSRTICC